MGASAQSDRELLPQEQVLEHERLAATERSAQYADEERDPIEHGPMMARGAERHPDTVLAPYRVTPRDFVLFSLASGLSCGVLAHVAVGWEAFSLFAASLGLLAPFAYYAHRRERRLASWRTALADGVDQLRDAIRSGLSVDDGLAGLASTGPVALQPDSVASCVSSGRWDWRRRWKRCAAASPTRPSTPSR